MEVVGRHMGLNEAERKVLLWLEAGLSHMKGKILVEPGLRVTKKYQEWPDFILVTPTHGVIVIECKGHYSEEIRTVSNVDLLTSRGVLRYGRQLASYGCLMRDLISPMCVPVSKFVVFPNILRGDKAATYISEFNQRSDDVRVLFHENLSTPFSLDALGVRPLSHSLEKSDLEKLLQLLNPTRIIEHNYLTDLQQSEKQLKILDQEQINFINHIKDGHYLLNGLPGTGKTIVLMKLAEREMQKGKKVLYTCYNNPLGEYVASHLGEDVARTTFSIYCEEVKKMRGSYFQGEKWDELTIEFLKQNLPTPLYDVLLVDEYQDLDDDEFLILMHLLKPDGILVMAGDTLQNIRGKKESWKGRGIHIVGHGRSTFFKSPYRARPEIVDFGLKFVMQEPALEKEVKKYFKENDFEHILCDMHLLDRNLKFMVHSKYEFQDELEKIIKINPDAKMLIITNSNQDRFALGHFESDMVRIETYGRAKGLEADIVILYNIDGYKKFENKMVHISPAQKLRSVFSAICRSRQDVYIHGVTAQDYFCELKDLYNSLLSKKAA